MAESNTSTGNSTTHSANLYEGGTANIPGWGSGGIMPSPACAVGKQAALYLSRVAPRQTIDHLAHEAAQQMVEPDERQSYTAAGGGGAGGGGGGARRMSTPGGGMGGGTPVGPSRGIVSPSGAVEWIRVSFNYSYFSSFLCFIKTN